MDTLTQTTDEAILQVGRVTAVRGRVIDIRVHKTKNSSHLAFKGELLKNVSVGSYVKIVKGFTRIIGKVDGEYIEEDRLSPRSSYRNDKARISRALNVSLLGFFEGEHFKRGIKEMPLLDSECYLLSNAEFSQVHNFLKEGDSSIDVGSLALEKGQAIKVSVDGLFASHIGIFGNTGSGKSYTLAKLYYELFRRYRKSKKFRKSARFLLIDFNGEYASEGGHAIVDSRYKNTYRLSTRAKKGGDRIPMTLEALIDPDFWTVFLEATEKVQTPFLGRALGNDYLSSRMEDPQLLKNYLSDLISMVTQTGDRNMEKATVGNLLSECRDAGLADASIDALIVDYRDNLKYHSMQQKYYYQSAAAPILYSDNPAFQTTVVTNKINALTIDTADLDKIDKIRLRIILQYYADIIRGFANREFLSPLIKRLDKRIGDLKKVIEVGATGGQTRNLTIVSLKDVSIQMRKIIPLLLCKRGYADHKAQNDDSKFLNIIVDEAHNILSQNSERESEQWKDYRLETFEEIVKEGRKFGVFLTIASQRPSDISPTIISQLHNYFLHRLINNEDIKAVERTISFLDKLSFEYLPILPTGTCIFAGLIANVPIVLDVGSIADRNEPRSKTMTLQDKWE